MWKELTDDPRYEAHPDGMIRHKRLKTVLKPWLHKHGKSPVGYLKVSLSEGRNLFLHRAILSTFDPPPSPKHHAAHKNHDPFDNRLENLHWRTHRENHNDSPGKVKTLSPEQAAELWRLRDKEGLGYKRIAKAMGLKPQRVQDIIRYGYYADFRYDKN